jgi:protein-S-isoprenylcysteine O-methyltransferase Ste14
MSPSSRLASWAVPVLFAIAAVITGAHATRSIGHALADPTTRAWLIALYGALRAGVAFAFAFFTVGRAAPKRPARSPIAFIACAMAVSPVIAFADPGTSVPNAVVLAGDMVAVVFCLWLLVSVLFLGRCFGVLPEARGVVRRGPYRLVRHPVYLGELGAWAGLAIAAPSVANGGVFAGLIVAQVVRMRLEERALAEAFPEYVAYASGTPSLIPRLGLASLVSKLAGRVRTDPMPVSGRAAPFGETQRASQG